MARLTAAARRKLPASDFALGKGRYPIEDKSHADDALARVSEYGTPEQKARVRAAVKRKYPGMKVSGGKKKKRANGPEKGSLAERLLRSR